jgi:hypothetical protein
VHESGISQFAAPLLKIGFVQGFVPAGTIELLSPAGSPGYEGRLEYTYNERRDNRAARTLQFLSTSADQRMRACFSCEYFPDFQAFKEYYGLSDYADSWIMAAFYRNVTEGYINGDTSFHGMTRQGRAEGIERGTVFLSVLMYVIRALELSVSDCKANCGSADCNANGVHSLDEAVAFYTGSLEVTGGNQGSGVFLYSHANQRALEARTGGEHGDTEGGHAHVNLKVFQEFNIMKGLLSSKKCEEAEKSKLAIVNYLKVPMIQGLLRVAFQREHYAPDPSKKAEVDMLTVSGATYAAAILPWIHACDAGAAKEIFRMMRVGSDNKNVDFSLMQGILEPLYTSCLKTTCTEVGGIWNSATRSWFPGGEPCGMTRTDDKLNEKLKHPDKPLPMLTVIGFIVASAAGLLLVCLFCKLRCNRKNSSPSPEDLLETSMAATSGYRDSDPAAVVEIS